MRVGRWVCVALAGVVLATVAAGPAQAEDAPILGTWTWGSGERQVKVTSTGGDTYAGAYLAGVDDCGNSVGGHVVWHITGSGKAYTGSSEWLQTSPECKNIGPGEATWTLDSDTTGTYCSTSPNREVVDDCATMTKIASAPASSGAWWKWLLGVIAATAAGSLVWWNRNHAKARDGLGQAAQTALDNSGPLQTAGALPGAPVPTAVAGKTAGMLDTTKRLGDITAGTPAVFDMYGQSSLSGAGTEYLLSGDQTRFDLIDKIESSGNRGAIVKAANLVHANGAAAVTEADLRTIITEFGL